MNQGESEEIPWFFKWSNFGDSFVAGFSDLVNDEHMVDVTLCAGETSLHAHKLVLSVCSTYFRRIFKRNPCPHHVIILHDVRASVVSSLLDFMYRGEAVIPEQDVDKFLKLATTLEINGLRTDKKADINTGAADGTKTTVMMEDAANDCTDDCVRVTNDCQSVTEEANQTTKATRSYRDRPTTPEEAALALTNGSLSPLHAVGLFHSPVPSTWETDVPNRDKDAAEVQGSSSSREPKTTGDSGHTTQVDEQGLTPPATTLTIPRHLYTCIDTTLGGYFIVIEGGFVYRKKSECKTTEYWICTQKGCPSKGTREKATGALVLCSPTVHNHPARELQVKKKPQQVPERRPRKRIEFVGRDYELIKSEKSNRNMILHEGFIYRQDNMKRKEQMKTQHSYWRCRVKGCKARTKTTQDGDLTIMTPDHNHPPDVAQVQRRRLRAALKIEALMSNKPPKDIFKEYNIRDQSLRKFFRSMRQTRAPSEPIGDITPSQVLEATPLLEMDDDEFNIESLVMDTLGDHYSGLTNMSG